MSFARKNSVNGDRIEPIWGNQTLIFAILGKVHYQVDSVVWRLMIEFTWIVSLNVCLLNYWCSLNSLKIFTFFFFSSVFHLMGNTEFNFWDIKSTKANKKGTIWRFQYLSSSIEWIRTQRWQKMPSLEIIIAINKLIFL